MYRSFKSQYAHQHCREQQEHAHLRVLDPSQTPECPEINRFSGELLSGTEWWARRTGLVSVPAELNLVPARTGADRVPRFQERTRVSHRIHQRPRILGLDGACRYAAFAVDLGRAPTYTDDDVLLLRAALATWADRYRPDDDTRTRIPGSPRAGSSWGRRTDICSHLSNSREPEPKGMHSVAGCQKSATPGTSSVSISTPTRRRLLGASSTDLSVEIHYKRAGRVRRPLPAVSAGNRLRARASSCIHGRGASDAGIPDRILHPVSPTIHCRLSCADRFT